MSAQSQAVEQHLHDQLQVAGFDPSLITTVIETVLGILSSCRNKQAARDAMASPGRLERVLVRRELQRELRENGEAVGRQQLDWMVDQLLEAARNADQADRDALMNHTGKFDTI